MNHPPTKQGLKTPEQLGEDIKFVKGILPDHYTVEESKKAGSIHCFSGTGIFADDDSSDDNEHWGYVFKAIKNHFAERFQEVYHNVCSKHLDFTIYLRKTPQPRAGEEITVRDFEEAIRKDIWTDGITVQGIEEISKACYALALQMAANVSHLPIDCQDCIAAEKEIKSLIDQLKDAEEEISQLNNQLRDR